MTIICHMKFLAKVDIINKYHLDINAITSIIIVDRQYIYYNMCNLSLTETAQNSGD